MSTKSTYPRILLTTSFRRSRKDFVDIIGKIIYGKPRLGIKRTVSPGLRFIKQNVPEVEILEYPLWSEFVEKLKEGWDVVGFSFYQSEIEEIGIMAEEARRRGSPEIWAGNFGALDESISDIVDRVFIGPPEDEIAQMFGYRVPEDEIIHPPIMFHATLVPGNIRHFTAGVLYTQRGCAFKCPFCQTPNFDDNHYYVNFESIKRVLTYYKELGIKYIFVTDEILGINRDSAERLTSLLSHHGFYWYAQSRISLFLHNLDKWYDRGLRVPSVGLETMTQKALDLIGKKQNTEEIIEYARRTAEKGYMHRTAYSMIGFENMDYEETIQDALKIKKAGFDMHSVNIITPYPGTKLWDDLEQKYGIFDKDYHNYDARHLVWNHPAISPPEMLRLLETVSRMLNTPWATYGRSFHQLFKEKNKDKFRDIWQALVKSPVVSMRIDEREQVFFPVDRTPTHTSRSFKKDAGLVMIPNR